MSSYNIYTHLRKTDSISLTIILTYVNLAATDLDNCNFFIFCEFILITYSIGKEDRNK